MIEDEEKYKKCIERAQVGYVCDFVYPLCKGCEYDLPIEKYNEFKRKNMVQIDNIK